ncbi:choline/ethanolamine kinase family protein [Marinobacter sp. F4216]|uniref:choline/ethanolamine kinase family protein n=1 Tax=Marinobacter sp. F4216 TaxID=2874281 RepID=UPI001CBFAF19|nr:choline/ethanolamine kinase family protein [Marinobacter sp. F4216]MBZ2169068.1 phosphotransferase family protein [Marinobacter sp. F4216]
MPQPSTDIVPADWPTWSTPEPRVIRPLPGGLTNRSYLLAAGDRRLVLRLNTRDSAALDIDRAAEAEALGRATRAELCAPVVHNDPQHRYLVTEFIEGDTCQPDDPRHLDLLADLTADIHALPAVRAHLQCQDKADTYWQAIDPAAAVYGDLLSLGDRVSDHLAAAEALCEKRTLCHNDLVAGNLVLSGPETLWAIDWEYAAMGDPFFDIALIVEEHCLDENQQSRFLEGYLRRPVTAPDLERLQHGRVVYRYLSLLWYAVRLTRYGQHQPETEAIVSEGITALNGFLQDSRR